jgi:Flp pilus assembly protein TadG
MYEHGRAMMIRQALRDAAREGVRHAVVKTSSDSTTEIQTFVTRFLADTPVTNVDVKVYSANSNAPSARGWNTSAFGSGITVEVNADAARVLPTFGLLAEQMHFEAKSVAMCEAN